MKKLRIAIYYPVITRNDGPPLFYNYALKALGHDVVHLSGEEMSHAELQKYGKFDLHVEVDYGRDGLGSMIPFKLIEKYPSPSVFIPCDTHITPEGRDYRFNRALNFDYNFFCHSRGMEEFKALHPEKHAEWMPCAVEPKAYPNEPVAIKKYDIGFVGFVTFEKRAIALDRMFKEFPNFFYGQRFSRYIYGGDAFQGDDASDIFRKSRIVFNTAAVDDMGMRVSEATATGSFLLTEWVPDLEKAGYIDGKHLVTYKTFDEAVEKAKYYLMPEHEDEREAIAKAGMEHTLKNHTYEIRAKKVLSTIFPNP